ncbi:MAG: ABC transporter permease [Vulcanimicrobiaceae bacterium]
MPRYIVSRVVQALLAMWAVVTAVFGLMHLAGDPIAVLAPETMGVQQRAALAHELGFDRPLGAQYVHFLSDVLRGQLGVSYYTNQPAMHLVLERLGVTIELVVVAMAIAVLVGVPFGIVSALKPDGAVDRVLRLVSVIGSSVPTFFLGILLILFFSVEFTLLPSSGMGDWRNLVLPALTLAFYRIALFTRLIRAMLIGELSQDYVRTARAKGLANAVVTVKHALRNALLPFITAFGLQFGQLLGGAVITETIFALPGMNRLALEAMTRLDYPIIIAYVIVIAALFNAINLAVDLVYGVADPRVTYG